LHSYKFFRVKNQGANIEKMIKKFDIIFKKSYFSALNNKLLSQLIR